MTKGLRESGVAVGVLGLLLGTTAGYPAMANPDYETIWEEGTVTSISDGDTLVADLDAGSGARGSNRIRTIGVQAPEVASNGTPADCGAGPATDRLSAQLPVGARVQTRSVDVASSDAYSSGRIVRSLYAQDEEGNWYDTSRGTVSDGWMMWFPLAADSSNKPEWAHNLEYRVLADDAAGQGRGLWSRDLCGAWPQPDANLRVWAKYYGTERVYVENRGSAAVDLGGWTIRDSAISAYRKLPPGTVVGAGEVREVYAGDMNLNNLPASNAAFEGDALYLMDNSGPFNTGNLRAWFPYPCNPDDCGDPLQGKVTITRVQDATPTATKAPSAPGSVSATASTDGSGSVTVTWAPPTDLQAESVTYTVFPDSPNGGAPLTPVAGITGLSHTFTGLTLGRAYSFVAAAVNAAGTSPASTPSGAVSPTGLPKDPATGQPQPPANISVDVRGSSATVSWRPPAGAGGEPPLSYAVSAAASDGSATLMCPATPAGVTSCTVQGLTAASYTFTVTASFGSSSSSASTTQPIPPPATTPLSKPTAVTALAGDSRAFVSWERPDADGGHPIASYTVMTVEDPTRSCKTIDASTSCVVEGLTNGTAYTFKVTATNAIPPDTENTSPASDASPSITPYKFIDSPATGTAPPSVDDPFVGGEFVELTNTTPADVRLGGYGLWNSASSNYPNGGSVEDRPAYLFPADARIAAGQRLVVHFGPVPAQLPPTPAGATRLWTGEGQFIGGAGVTTADFVELANLNRAQISCVPVDGGTCRGTQPVSISSSPVGVTARATPSSVSVNWGAPISRGGTGITQYTATAFDAPVGGNPIASCTAGGGERTCSFAGGIGTKYFVEVVAHNSQGISGPSWRVQAAPRTVPTAPGNVTASGTPGGINVSWTPAGENGATITKYTASAYTAGTGGNPVGSCTTSNGSMTGCTIMKLQGGIQYFIDVVATNRAGNGAPSSPRVAGTPGPGGAVSTYSKGKVTVRWDPPAAGSNTITGYTAKLYTKSKGGTKVGECSAAAGKTSCTTKKMKKRSRYYIDLSTQSASGTFTVKPRIVTGPPKKASKPKVTSATPSSRKVTVAWAPPSFNGYSYLKGYGARLYSKSKGGKVRASCSAGPSTTTCTTKTMKKGTYYSAVRVKNSKGWSSWSKRVKVVVR